MKHRSGFTLTELLVVIGIIIAVAALVLAVVAGRSSDRKISDGTELMQAKILIARTKAFSEQVPRGVRLLPGKVQDGFMHRLVYIEQASPLAGGNATVSQQQSGTFSVSFDQLDITGGFGSPDQWRVQDGDAISFLGGASNGGFGPYTIYALSPTPGGGGSLTIYIGGGQQPPPPTLSTSSYSIIRANRPLAGEDPIDLPDGIGIDLLDTLPVQPLGSPSATALGCSVIQADRYYFSTNAMTTLATLLPPAEVQALQQNVSGGSFSGPDLQNVLTLLGISPADFTTIMLNTGLYDILFSPDGSVLFSGTTGTVTSYPTGKIILWTCDTTGAQSQASAPLVTPGTASTLPVPPPAPAINNNYKGNARLIVIYTRSGLIAGQPVDRTLNPAPPQQAYTNPFSFAQDGLPGGL
jgi:type II secretory pathway pseudopilin PulG